MLTMEKALQNLTGKPVTWSDVVEAAKVSGTTANDFVNVLAANVHECPLQAAYALCRVLGVNLDELAALAVG